MANLRDIQKRISAVRSTQQITRTMEMIASAKIRKASDRLAASTPYSRAMDLTLDKLVGETSSIKHPLLDVHSEVSKVLLVVIVSDRGLAGAFNSSVLRHCDKIIAALSSKGIETKLIACGKKAVAYFSYRGHEMLAQYCDLSADPTLEQACEISSLCSELYTKGEIDEAYIIYNHARNAADQDLIEARLLPIDPQGLFEAEEFRPDPSKWDDYERHWKKREKTESDENNESSDVVMGAFEFDPDSATVLSSLLPSFVDTVVYHGLIDSAAAEQGARRKAMKAATDNASEMVETLQRIYNRARQGTITTEITEIVGGAAAAEG